MRKKITALLLAAIMLLALTACGTTAQPASTEAPAADAAADAPAEAPAEETALDYPTQNISWIVPVAAGAGVDLVTRQVADMLDLVFFSALFHQLDSFLAAEDERLDRQVFLDDLRHFRLDGGQVFVGELLVAQIDVIIEALLRRRAIGKVRFRIQALDRLRQDMRRGMADDVKLFLFRAFGNVSVVVDNLHDDLLLFLHIWDESKNARPSRFAEGRAIKKSSPWFHPDWFSLTLYRAPRGLIKRWFSPRAQPTRFQPAAHLS